MVDDKTLVVGGLAVGGAFLFRDQIAAMTGGSDPVTVVRRATESGGSDPTEGESGLQDESGDEWQEDTSSDSTDSTSSSTSTSDSDDSLSWGDFTGDSFSWESSEGFDQLQFESAQTTIEALESGLIDPVETDDGETLDDTSGYIGWSGF